MSAQRDVYTIRPFGEVHSGDRIWSLKANQLFTDCLARKFDRANGDEGQDKGLEVVFVDEQDAYIAVGDSKFYMRLSEVEHSEAFHMDSASRQLDFCGEVGGRYTITGSSRREDSLLPPPPLNAAIPTKKRSIASIEAVSSASVKSYAAVSSQPPSSTPVGAATHKEIAPTKRQKSSTLSSLAVKLPNLSLEVTPGDIFSFFSGLKFSGMRMCFHGEDRGQSAKTNRVVAYVKFESSHGMELALQRSGERLKVAEKGIAKVEPAGQWELFCAWSLGLDCAPSVHVSRMHALLHEQHIAHHLTHLSPQLVADFWRSQIVRFRAAKQELTEACLQGMVRVAHDRCLVESLLDEPQEDNATERFLPLENQEWPSLDALVLALRREIIWWWEKCANLALQAQDGTLPLLDLAQRVTDLYEQLYCVMWSLLIEQRDLALECAPA